MCRYKKEKKEKKEEEEEEEEEGGGTYDGRGDILSQKFLMEKSIPNMSFAF